MKIGILYHPILHIGGVETNILSTIQHSHVSDYQFIVIAQTSDEFSAKAEALGIEVVPWTYNNLLDLRALIQLVRIIKENNISLLHTHSPSAAIFGRIAARYNKIPVIVTVHLTASEYFSEGSSLKTKIRRLIYSRIDQALNFFITDRLIFVSRISHNKSVDRHQAPSNRSLVIRNGIDLTRFDLNLSKEEIRIKMGLPIKEILICFLGRLDYQKGLDILLEAVNILHAKHDFKLLVIGDGPQRDELSDFVNSHQCGKTVDFLGFRNDIPELLRMSDIFVLSSRFEGMPISILEAMAAGLPCVVTNVGENASLIKNEINGFLVESENPESLASALMKLIENDKLRTQFGLASHEYAQEFNDNKMVQKIQDVYNSLESIG
jgi:glycosyltransferase involved in cell wall biosynthesis